ncbi:hypothetical protein KP77_14030 [Jeotgalibacillus alimentarius]|uniref:Uncharacterized protein n=1 Tax=Jeotgalibacillus alimentarius TaxID=135826 RepID=A0A0C2W3Z4_9BACL|nr:hypothetical protein [Jeotgalibacillus alimentarius]KIL50783.1 hypothetical protein KP77_14030 [Jeotgalibacillus alimentarius]
MKTVLFLVQTHLSSCSLLAAEFVKVTDQQVLLRGTFAWQSQEMSEYSFEGMSGSAIEEEFSEFRQLQRKELEEVQCIVVSESAEEALIHLLKSASTTPEVVSIRDLGGKRESELDDLLMQGQTEKALNDIKQKSLILLEKLN